jgi:hypothetical protein
MRRLTRGELGHIDKRLDEILAALNSCGHSARKKYRKELDAIIKRVNVSWVLTKLEGE